VIHPAVRLSGYDIAFWIVLKNVNDDGVAIAKKFLFMFRKQHETGDKAQGEEDDSKQ